MGNGKLSGGGGGRDGKESFLYPNILFQRDKRDKRDKSISLVLNLLV